MTRDDIIRMAREAGGVDIVSNGWTSWVGTQSTEFLERFAAAEREECAKVCEELRPSKPEYDQRFYDGCTFSAAAIRNRVKQ